MIFAFPRLTFRRHFPGDLRKVTRDNRRLVVLIADPIEAGKKAADDFRARIARRSVAALVNRGNNLTGHGFLMGAFRNLDEDHIGAVFGEKVGNLFTGGHADLVHSPAKTFHSAIEEFIRTLDDRERERTTAHFERQHSSKVIGKHVYRWCCSLSHASFFATSRASMPRFCGTVASWCNVTSRPLTIRATLTYTPANSFATGMP